MLKGQSNEIFDLQFFIFQTYYMYLCTWPRGQNIFGFGWYFAEVFRIVKKVTDSPGVSDPGEIDSPGYQTRGVTYFLLPGATFLELQNLTFPV